jgi:hypothetical protein
MRVNNRFALHIAVGFALSFASQIAAQMPAFGDSVITFAPGVSRVPDEITKGLLPQNYVIKQAWTEPKFTPQSLSRSPWEKAMRQANLAVLVKGEMPTFSAPLPGVLSIEDEAPFENEEMLGEPPFDPVACPGIIYAFHHYSEADQKLETANSCDNYAIRPRGGFVYRIAVSSATPKSIEVYEHGSQIAAGEGEVFATFNYGYRQRYITVRGAPGSYRIEIFPVRSDRRKEKLNSWNYSDQFSNGYGFGIPDASQIAGKAPQASEWKGAHMMGAESYWNAGITGQGVKVAVVDTGINFRHPFLKDTVVGGYTPFGNKTDPDSYADVYGHGSHVAGIIHQVAPKADLLSVRVFSADDGGTTADIVERGVRWAIDNGAKIINLSLGGPDAPKSWLNVFRYGASKGVLFAVASGNDRGFMPLFPAVFAGTIPGFGFSVGALDQLGSLAVFSNWTGNDLNMKHVSSHGARVLSVDYETDGFVSMSGTSMAAPQIAGFLALARQANPNATNEEIIQLVSKNVKRAAIND